MYFIECLTYYILYPLEQLDGCLSPGEGQIPVQNGEWHTPHGQVLHPLCVWSGVNKQGVTQGAVHQKLTCLDIAAWLSEGQSHSSVTICAS